MNKHLLSILGMLACIHVFAKTEPSQWLVEIINNSNTNASIDSLFSADGMSRPLEWSDSSKVIPPNQSTFLHFTQTSAGQLKYFDFYFANQPISIWAHGNVKQTGHISKNFLHDNITELTETNKYHYNHSCVNAMVILNSNYSISAGFIYYGECQ